MKKLLLIAVAATGLSLLAEPFRLHSVFGDHMVLQRGKPVRFSGTGTRYREISVEFRGVRTTAAVGGDGEWSVTFPAGEAGGPFDVIVRPLGGTVAKEIVLNDVWVGEVWICSGQSNMEMPVWGSSQYYRLPDGQTVAAAAKDPKIRLYKVPRAVDPDRENREAPQGAAWRVATTPEAVEPFSATGWWFGQALRREFGPDMPIGLVDASWGGSRIEPWIPRAQYERDDDRAVLDSLDALRTNAGLSSADYARELEKRRAEQLEKLSAWLEKFFASAPEATREALAAWGRPETDTAGWTRGPHAEMLGLDRPGVAWYRFAFEVPEALAGKELVFFADYVNDSDETFLDGRMIGHTRPGEVSDYWAAPRQYAFSATAGRHVIAIRAMDHFGSGAVSDRLGVRGPDGSVVADFSKVEWCERIEFRADLDKIGVRPAVDPGDDDGRLSFGVPTTLWNAMVAPVAEMNVRGTIWYQGCSNANEAEAYPNRERQLFEGWRTAFRDPELPFLVTQISAMIRHSPNRPGPDDECLGFPPEKDLLFVDIREAQMKMADYPHAGLACTIDIGDKYDIHPKNKREVGRRLCHEAMRVAYGRADRLPGPRVASVCRDGAAVLVRIRDAGAGLEVAGGTVGPHLFALAGTDGVWHWAGAELVGPDAFRVTAAEVPEPKRIRWCWNGYPPGVNVHRKGDGLPIFPFESGI